MAQPPEERDRLPRAAAANVDHSLYGTPKREEPPATPPAAGETAPTGTWRCCDQMQPVAVGECGDGCCTDYRCANCGKTWRYEWPD